MPTISVFFGISIRMYFGDHAPPHFHAYYQGEAGTFAIDTLELLEGALEHRPELRNNWKHVEAGEALASIEPLE